MNEEEKKAIKYFYNLRATIDECKMLFNEDINVKCGKEMIKQITTVLNILEKKDRQIEEKTNRIKNLEIECQKHFDNMMDTIQDNHKKDNIIEDMACMISAMATGIDAIINQEKKRYCEFLNSYDDCCWKTDKDCKDCIKEYFKKKVESEDK